VASVSGAKAQLPDKLYFKIGEVASIVGVQPYVLRYWESEFSAVRPSKTRSKHRLYRRRDVEALLQIKRLLHDERFTIEGARKQLKSLQKGQGRQSAAPVRDHAYRTVLSQLRQEIQSLHRMLT
jgi:DNA-binding transcriptional MerR regulator